MTGICGTYLAVLRQAGQVSTSANVALSYDPADPCTVRIELPYVDGPMAWAFSRRLLVDGLASAVGEGVVRVRPQLGQVNVLIECLQWDETWVQVWLPRRHVAQFVDRTFAVVSARAEAEALTVAAEALMASFEAAS